MNIINRYGRGAISNICLYISVKILHFEFMTLKHSSKVRKMIKIKKKVYLIDNVKRETFLSYLDFVYIKKIKTCSF